MSNQEPTNQDSAGDEVAREEPSAVPNLPKIIRFDSLARCGEEVWIENNGQIYRLRKTKQGKLILTK
ncbi:MAG: hemin uptake protein HemP [Mariniblastus sp.]